MSKGPTFVLTPLGHLGRGDQMAPITAMDQDELVRFV